jgi:hypothetical protein
MGKLDGYVNRLAAIDKLKEVYAGLQPIDRLLFDSPEMTDELGMSDTTKELDRLMNNAYEAINKLDLYICENLEGLEAMA